MNTQLSHLASIAAEMQGGLQGGMPLPNGINPLQPGFNGMAGMPPMAMASHGMYMRGLQSQLTSMAGASGMMQPSGCMPTQSNSLVSLNAPAPSQGRRLQILDHTVHRIDTTQSKEGGTLNREMVVSNLRHFTLKVGLMDMNGKPVTTDEDIRLQAQLFYENGLPVEQLATCEPLLVGKTEVTTIQSVADFKLRITSLSSHRDKQRFRIRVVPRDPLILQREPHMSVVTTPMKCVTKISSNKVAGRGGGDKEDEELDALAPPSLDAETVEPPPKRARGSSSSGGAAGLGAEQAAGRGGESETGTHINKQADQIQQLQVTNHMILEQLKVLKNQLASISPEEEEGSEEAGVHVAGI